jgi:hypothetical protein
MGRQALGGSEQPAVGGQHDAGEVVRRVENADRAVRKSVFCILRAMLSIRLERMAVLTLSRPLGPSSEAGLMTFIAEFLET